VLDEKRINELLILALIKEGELQANEQSLAEEILATHGEQVFACFLFYREELKTANRAPAAHAQALVSQYKQ